MTRTEIHCIFPLLLYSQGITKLLDCEILQTNDFTAQ